MTDLTTRRLSERQDPGHPPAPRGLPEQRGAGPSVPAPGGVPLGRLLAMARLSAAQALEIGAGVLAAAEAAPADDLLVADPVVTADGRVALGAAGERRPLPEVLADVAAAVPPAGAGTAPEQRLPGLERGVRDLPEAGLPVVARRLQESAAALDRPAVRAELGALVRAVGGAGGSAGGSPAGRPTGRAEPMRRTSLTPRSTGRRVGAWVLSILVLSAVVVSEVVLLRDDITADIDLLLDAGRAGDEESDAPEPVAPQIPAPAPASAGTVAAVDLRPLGPCAPGAACSVRLVVQLVPSAEPQVVTWSYRVADGCTGPFVAAPGGTVTVPPHADRAAAVGGVVLPPADGVAVVAVTDSPAVAASAPVVVGPCASAGQGG